MDNWPNETATSCADEEISAKGWEWAEDNCPPTFSVKGQKSGLAIEFS